MLPIKDMKVVWKVKQTKILTYLGLYWLRWLSTVD